MTHWTVSDIPSQRGRTAVVTGTGGLGFQDALALARAGANVIIAGRNPSKGAAAVDQIRQSVPGANVTFGALDLASLESIESFGERLRSSRDSLDLLINNAAVMAPPKRQVTCDGFELQFGTNYLGHFALTAQLLPLLRKGNKRAWSAFQASPLEAARSTSMICKLSAATGRCRFTANRNSLA
ncbi:SDR family NAD(P)-dependent oxidoreductase [Pseudomonas sp. St290]|uniref:SDR family NAD(P)-dependent oxidoreductase n=1 Tax=Pseudomonas sp. St290 TaxID=1602166 RepID=UPI001BEEC68A|nr:SDR family NAD(P)-dependent oxidoreductase [Pseudomonas sp. St290]BBH31496.1 short chain dehydrogenase [Pseudomonas sp. St290]